jgi:4-amino-4-deoxy-L-arabinose transferase-like glycosyltransferase
MKKIILVFIFVLALFLRVYKLDEVPVGFLWDEAALGYNAYSILYTGRDEYGKLFPAVFKSFGDYKPGFYVYLTIPSVAILGLNEFSTRLPSAIFGSLTVLLIYFLISKGTRLTNNKENEILAIFSSAVLAITPWHINFSRGAWELNVMLFELI